ncbi:hypothetical protein ABIA95_008726 [Bradyrhizobium sp. LA8.1]
MKHDELIFLLSVVMGLLVIGYSLYVLYFIFG